MVTHSKRGGLSTVTFSVWIWVSEDWGRLISGLDYNEAQRFRRFFGRGQHPLQISIRAEI